MSKTQQLTQDLIAKASVSPQDKGCQALITQRLHAAGFEINNLKFGEVDNFWAIPWYLTHQFLFLQGIPM